MKLEDISLDTRYEEIFSITKEEQEAMELLAINDGELFQPLFVWKGQDTLVYGYQYLEILKTHPDIKYMVRQIEFKDWQEAHVWAIEHYIAQPVLLLWQKLEAAIKCESYWLLKEDAKKSHGNRKESPSVCEGDSDGSKEVNAIIAEKVGCSTTYVYNFKKILGSNRMDIIKKCRIGELSISAAYAKLFLPKKPRKSKPTANTPVELEFGSGDIFDECEQSIKFGTNKAACFNGVPVDSDPIIQKIKTTEVPDGAIWLTFHKQACQMQVLKKTYDPEKGNIHMEIHSFNCKTVSMDDDIIILEAGYITGGTEIVQQKDETDFDSASRKAS